MIPRTCDNDDCDYDENGRWIHVDGCVPMEPLTREEAEELIRRAPEDSFLANINLGGLVL